MVLIINSKKLISSFNSTIKDPFLVPYENIYVISDEKNKCIELIEKSNCFSGICWSYHHYSQSSLVKSSKIYGNCLRHIIKIGKSKVKLKSSTKAACIASVVSNIENGEIEITYSGLGGGGIGATKCRAMADGVLKYKISECGGEKEGTGTIYLPKRFRVLVAIDDTDSCDQGATWTLTHNIGNFVNCNNSIFVSQSLVQLYPVPEKTQNCMSTVLEFWCLTLKDKEELIDKIKCLLVNYSVSKNTGMLVYSGFLIPKALKNYSIDCRKKRIIKEETIQIAKKCNIEIILNGNGIIGALAAFYWFSNPLKSTNPKFLLKTLK